jgi:hypothetical protein
MTFLAFKCTQGLSYVTDDDFMRELKAICVAYHIRFYLQKRSCELVM